MPTFMNNQPSVCSSQTPRQISLSSKHNTTSITSPSLSHSQTAIFQTSQPYTTPNTPNTSHTLSSTTSPTTESSSLPVPNSKNGTITIYNPDGIELFANLNCDDTSHLSLENVHPMTIRSKYGIRKPKVLVALIILPGVET